MTHTGALDGSICSHIQVAIAWAKQPTLLVRKAGALLHYGDVTIAGDSATPFICLQPYASESK